MSRPFKLSNIAKGSKVDETKCFVCKENPPNGLEQKLGTETFKLCKDCTDLAFKELKKRNRFVRRSLIEHKRLNLFEYIFGLELTEYVPRLPRGIGVKQ